MAYEPKEKEASMELMRLIDRIYTAFRSKPEVSSQHSSKEPIKQLQKPLRHDARRLCDPRAVNAP